MGLFQRAHQIVEAKANTALDKAENPNEMLDLSYQEQIANLQKVRRALADVATATKRLELQASTLRQQADKLQDQAKQALGQNREDLAREALTRRAALADQLQSLGTQHEQVEAQQQQLEATAARLQAKVEAFRTRKETLKATYTASQAQASIGEAVSAVRLRLADAQTEELLPDEEAALVERFTSEAVLARPVPAALREGLIRQVVADVSRAMRGRAGPLDAALRDPEVFDIMVNAPDAIFVRRAVTGIVRLGESFPANDEVDAFVARFAARARRQFSEADPLLNVQLTSGVRLNAVRYPVARDGTALTLRLHSRFPPWDELLQLGICPDGTRDWGPRRVRWRPGCRTGLAWR